MLYVAGGGAMNRFFGAVHDVAFPPAAVDAIEVVRLYGGYDAVYFGRGHWYEVWVAGHEADESAIGYDGYGVADEECTFAVCAVCPVQDGAALEVAATLN